jgi:hypothetical protein
MGMESISRRCIWLSSSLTVCACLLAATVARADHGASSIDARIRLRLPFAREPTVLGTGREPLQKGANGRYWIPTEPNWGFAADALEDEEDVTLEAWDGAVPLDLPSSLDLARGYRLFSVQALYRPRRQRAEGRTVEVSPYLGLGAGFSMPYAESPVDTYRAGDQFVWQGTRGLAGVSVRLTPSFSFYGEYSVDRPEANLKLGPGILNLDSPAERLDLGVSYDF